MSNIPIIPPPEVSAILDEATGDTEFSAQILPDRVQLLRTITKEVVREVLWPEAGQFARNLLTNSLNDVQRGPA